LMCFTRVCGAWDKMRWSHSTSLRTGFSTTALRVFGRDGTSRWIGVGDIGDRGAGKLKTLQSVPHAGGR
jgi:hypothetical protein